jgi:hypothetical protein
LTLQADVPRRSGVPPPIVVAIISSATSVALAIWSLMTARTAKSKALEAEEMAKQSELVRVKGLEAGAAILRSLTEFIIAVDTAVDLIRLQGGLAENSPALGSVEAAALSFAALRRCILENQIYLTAEITGAVNEFVKNRDLSPRTLPARLKEALDLHHSLALTFRRVYLSELPHNIALQQTAGDAGRS